jgi:hypothetical protein
MSKPLDYSKWDNLDDDSDDEAAPVPQPPRRMPPPAAAAAAPTPKPAAAAAPPPASSSAPTTTPSSSSPPPLARASAADIEEYEARRPGRLKRQLDDAMALLQSDMGAAGCAAELRQSQALPALDAVRALGASVRASAIAVADPRRPRRLRAAFSRRARADARACSPPRRWS